ncbi:MAG TPA: hypothetical protein VMD99_02450 [Terriglobales bacterium]|nr:hypothetical protein [Terriglobales bacterium]
MPTRLVSLFLLFATVPLFCQQGTIAGRADQWMWNRGKMMRPDSPPELDTRKAQLAAIHQDADELAALSASLQSDLQQLQKGMLSKDLAQKLKKVEKLSKRLRQEVAQ